MNNINHCPHFSNRVGYTFTTFISAQNALDLSSLLCYRIVNFGSFTGLYGLIIISLSTIFILSTFVGAGHNSKPSQTIYPHVRNVFQYFR